MKRKVIKILAIAVVGALLLMMVASLIIPANSAGARDKYELEITMLEEAQALHVKQRLFYVNNTGDTLDRAMFSVYGNMFRRRSAIMYEDESVFPAGFAPGGVEFSNITVNGESARWAMVGDSEYFMRVECALEPGEECVFQFEFTVLMTENRAFMGVSALDWRLSGFYPLLCFYDSGHWIANEPCAHSRYALTTAADYEVTLTVPGSYDVAATGAESFSDGVWHISANNIREFSASVGRAWRRYDATSAGGVNLHIYTNNRGGARRAADYLVEIITAYERLFGEFPARDIDIIQSDCALTFGGAIWIESDLFGETEELWRALAVALAEQYFGLGAYADPLADSWLCAALSEYAAYLAYEEIYGYDAFVMRMNKYLLPALQVTIPGDIFVTIDAGVLTRAQYEIAVRERGCVVMHEMRCEMGRANLVAALRRYYADNKLKPLCVETDLTAAMYAATGADWTETLTYWLFNVSDYSEQTIYHYE